MSSKKVILFIVEGITDEVSIGSVITKLNKNEKIYFQIVNKDITSDLGNDSSNIIKKINDQVNECIMQQHFKRKDIMKIVHIVDTDGAFISEEFIKYKDILNTEYSLEYIYTKNTNQIKQRNLRKSKILDKLSFTKIINKIPYEVYFFSTNLEHVLHNIQNAKDGDKMKLAEKFEDRFYENPQNFIKFINDNEYALSDTYNETWNFIKQSNNSLKRYTNFNLFFYDNN